jgi:sulfonate transport system substrate-binding protein
MISSRSRGAGLQPCDLTAYTAVAVISLGVIAITAQSLPTLRLAVNTTTIESAPLFVAAEGPAGATLRVSSGGIAQLVSLEADAATNSSTQAVLRSVANPNLRIVLTVAECFYRIVGRRSAGIRQVADLRAKRIGTPVNTSAHFYLAKTLRGANLTEADVTVVALAQNEMAAALEKGTVDAVSIWEPWAQYSIEAIGSDAVVLENRSIYRELFNLNTTADILSDPAKRSAVVDLVRATISSSDQVRRSPAAIRPLLVSKVNVREETSTAVWGQFRFPATLPEDLLDVLVEEETWAAAAQKRAPRSRTALSTLIERNVLIEAQKSAGR